MGKKNNKTTDTPQTDATVDDQVAKFFEDYPLSPYVLKAGDNLFLFSQSGAASDFAARNGYVVEKVENPNL
jgi:hypothetical protein